MKHPGADLKAVLFDLDGTLVDTADDFIPAVQQLRAENGLEPMESARIRRNVSNGSRTLVTVALSLTAQDSGFEAQRQRLLQLYAAILGKHARLYPGINSLLATLEKRNIAWGIATNKPSAFTWPLLEALNLNPPAAAVICPDDVTQPKPDPESLHLICNALGCTSLQAIYVGDHSRDIEAGRRAEMFTIAAAYGYIEDGDAAEHWGADLVARDSTLLGSLLLDHAEERSS